MHIKVFKEAALFNAWLSLSFSELERLLGWLASLVCFLQEKSLFKLKSLQAPLDVRPPTHFLFFCIFKNLRNVSFR